MTRECLGCGCSISAYDAALVLCETCAGCSPNSLAKVVAARQVLGIANKLMVAYQEHIRALDIQHPLADAVQGFKCIRMPNPPVP